MKLSILFPISRMTPDWGEQLICWQAGRAVIQEDRSGLEYCASRNLTKFNQGKGRLLHPE